MIDNEIKAKVATITLFLLLSLGSFGGFRSYFLIVNCIIGFLILLILVNINLTFHILIICELFSTLME